MKKIAILALMFASACSARVKFFSFCERGSGSVQQSLPGATVDVYYTGGAAGSVTTNGTAVTLVSGILFNANSGWPGLTITINSASYTISTVNSPVSITLTSTAGVQSSPVAYSMPATAPAAIYSDNAGTAKANPYSCDPAAQQFMFADNGTYDFKFSGTGISVPFTITAISGIDPVSIPLAASSQTYISAGMTFYQACSDAAARGQVLAIDAVWPSVSTGTCAARVQGGYPNGLVRPSSGQTVTMTMLNSPNTQVCDISTSGGTCTIVNPVANPAWWGAVADGTSDQTAAFQAAVDSVNAVGGGTVAVPPAPSAYMFATGVKLYSNVTFWIQQGAAVKRQDNAPQTCSVVGCRALLYTSMVDAPPSNIHVIVDGVLDGNRAGQSPPLPDNNAADGIWVMGWTMSSITGSGTIENSPLDGVILWCGGNGTWNTSANCNDHVSITGLPLLTITNSARNNISSIGGTYTTLENLHLTYAGGALGTAWSNSTTYAVGNVVSLNHVNWVAIAAGSGHQPNTSPTYWAQQSFLPEAGWDVEPDVTGQHTNGLTVRNVEADHNIRIGGQYFARLNDELYLGAYIDMYSHDNGNGLYIRGSSSSTIHSNGFVIRGRYQSNIIAGEDNEDIAIDNSYGGVMSDVSINALTGGSVVELACIGVTNRSSDCSTQTTMLEGTNPGIITTVTTGATHDAKMQAVTSLIDGYYEAVFGNDTANTVSCLTGNSATGLCTLGGITTVPYHSTFNQFVDSNWASETTGSANNALVLTLAGSGGFGDFTVGPVEGTLIQVHLTSSLQAGANTISLNGSTPSLAIKSHRNPANDIGVAYAGGGTFSCHVVVNSGSAVCLDDSQ